MDALWTAVAWLSIGLVAVSAWSMVRSLGADRPLRARPLLVTVAVSLAALVVYVAVLPTTPGAVAWVLGAVGLVAGALVSRSTRLSVVGAEVTGRPSPLLAVQWAVLFAVAQLAALGVIFDTPSSGMAALFLGTGVAVGGSAMLLWRRRVLAGHGAAGTLLCPHCHTRIALGSTRCQQCSWQLRTRARRAAWAPPRAGV